MSIKVKTKILFICLMLLSASFYESVCQTNHEVGKPFINYFSPKVYKSAPRNWCIAQDYRGVMYFGNESGILEYDGHFWRNIEVLGDQNIRSLAAAADGRIYVAAGTDFGYLDPDSKGQLEYKSLSHHLDSTYKNFGEVWDVAISTEGVFYKTRDEIFRWKDNEITVWDSIFAFRLYNVNDTIYSRNNGTGLMRIDGDDIKLMQDGAYFDSTGVYDMLPFKKNSEGSYESMLITTNGDGLFIRDDDKFIPFKTEADNFLINNQIYNATLTSHGNYVFATQRGGAVIIDERGKLLRIIDESSGLPTNVLFDVYEDNNEGLWLASENGIVYLNEPSPFSVFQNHGYLKNITFKVTRFNDQIYVTNDLGTLYLTNGEHGFQLVSGSDQPAYAILNYNNDLIVGTNSGVAQIENYAIKKQILDESSTFLTRSKLFPKRIYAGTYYGFSVIDLDNQNQLAESFYKETTDEITDIVEENDGSLWIAGYIPYLIHVTGNINEFASGSDENIIYEYYDNSNGLPGTDWGIHKVGNKMLVITDYGIYSFDKNAKRFVRDSTLGSVLSDSAAEVSLIAHGQNEELWILAYINDELHLGKAVPDINGQYKWEPDPIFQQLDLEYLTAIYVDTNFVTGNEKLWLSTQEGLVVYDSGIKNNITNEYRAIIRKVIVNEDSTIYYGTENRIDTLNEIILSYDNNDISFEFSAVSFNKPNSTLFHTFLEGYDEGWSNWNIETKKEFTNLSQGDYEFNVKGKNIFGNESSVAKYRFTILAPWYLSWWSYILYSLFIGSVLYSVRKFELDRKEKNSRIRLSELKAEAAEFQAKAAETQARLIQADNDRKTKELEEARELQLSMLPKVLPQLPHLDIAVFMQTATEVGGDYYDFSLKQDGSLNVALGDATGHGMKAGTLVTMIKSLFAANSIDKSLEEFFITSNNALKNSALDRMMMGLAMININNYTVRISNAGIPPVYIYRNNTNEVEEIKVNGLPLGAMKNSRYEVYESEITQGDLILLLSDGFPELQNANDEMFGYDRLKQLIGNSAENSAEEFISVLRKEISKWSFGKEPEDDMSFVVIKVK